MDYFRIYNGKDVVVAEGNDKAAACAEARQHDDGHLVGEGTRPDGSQYAFFVSKAPAALGM